MGRPPKAETWLAVASAIAKQSTCLRRQVGCVLTDARGHVLSTGYNGVASGMLHCNDSKVVFDGNLPIASSGAIPRAQSAPMPRGIATHVEYPNACAGATAPSGTALDACEAIHAEANALLQCENVYHIHTVYCTASPCMHCTKLLLGTGAREIFFLEEYPAPGAKELWEKSKGKVWWPGGLINIGHPTWVKWPLGS